MAMGIMPAVSACLILGSRDSHFSSAQLRLHNHLLLEKIDNTMISPILSYKSEVWRVLKLLTGHQEACQFVRERNAINEHIALPNIYTLRIFESLRILLRLLLEYSRDYCSTYT